MDKKSYPSLKPSQDPVKVDLTPFDKIPLNLPFTKGDLKYPPLKMGGGGGFMVEPSSKIKTRSPLVNGRSGANLPVTGFPD
jgi:hypothetical protein